MCILSVYHKYVPSLYATNDLFDVTNDLFVSILKIQLAVHIPNSALPKSLGGQLEVDHHLWLAKCNSILDSTDLWGISAEESFRVNYFLKRLVNNESTQTNF